MSPKSNDQHSNDPAPSRGGVLLPGQSVSLHQGENNSGGRTAILEVNAEVAATKPTPDQEKNHQIEANTPQAGSPGKHDLQQYHHAWQRYYGQYYQQRYQRQIETQERLAGRSDEIRAIIKGDPIPERKKDTQTSQLKEQLLQKVGERTKSFRKSHHFMPLLSALAVGFVFLFLQYNRVVFADMNAYISPGSTVDSSDVVLVDPTADLNVGQESKLIIPKINVNTKVFYDITSTAEDKIQAGLRDGVVRYNLPGADSFPGQVGNTVLLGHSSNDIFDPGNSKFVFVLLDRMQPGDIFYIHYQGKRYVYRVSEKKIIKPTEINALQVGTSKPMVTLVTCTPLGTDLNRLLVMAEQISPDPATASQSSSVKNETKPAEIPGSSPSFFDRVFKIF